MSPNLTSCRPEWIDRCLNRQLVDDELEAFESHLSQCENCRRRLSQSAASMDNWELVRASLQCGDNLSKSENSLDKHFDSSDPDDRSSFRDEHLEQILSPSDDDRMLGRIGNYEVIGIIGAGGMGIVVKAFDPALSRYVAIKILSPVLGSRGAARRRFSREAQAAAAVIHDNVIEIHGVSNTRGLPFLVMPYISGPSLQKRLDDEGPLSTVEILRIATQTAEGLAAAHLQGLVHRDIKPANILLANGLERVKLTDFGLARAVDDASLTRSGEITGTPQYMSPEQARGDVVDQRSDLFCLGSVMYAMSTGRPPFRSETSFGVLRCITDSEPRSIRELNPDTPDWLCAIIRKLMSKNVDERYPSAQAVAELLADCLGHVQQPALKPLPSTVNEASRNRSQPTWVNPTSQRLNRMTTRFGLALAFIVLVALLIAAVDPLNWRPSSPDADHRASRAESLAIENNHSQKDSEAVSSDEEKPEENNDVTNDQATDSGRLSGGQSNNLAEAIQDNQNDEQIVDDEQQEPVWGDPQHGLQLGFSGVGNNETYSPGDQIRFKLLLKNVSDEEIHVVNYWPEHLGRVFAPMIENSDGSRVEFPPHPRVRGGHFTLRHELQPGESEAIELQGILNIGGEDELPTGHTRLDRCWCPLSQGAYRLQGHFYVSLLDPSSGARIGVSTTLASGKVDIRVTERD